MPITCPSCHYDVDAAYARCPNCGTALQAGAAAPATPAGLRFDDDDDDGGRWEKTVIESGFTPVPPGRGPARGGPDFYEPIDAARQNGGRMRFDTGATIGAWSGGDDAADHTIYDRRGTRDGGAAVDDRTVFIRGGRKGHEGPLAFVVERSGIRAGKVHLLNEETRFGRHHENDVVLDDESVSKRHALIRLEEGRWILWDLASTNFTKLVHPDGRRERILAPVPLADLAEFELGEVRMTFLEVDNGVA